MEKHFKGFASDNYASVHPEVMSALAECNVDHAQAYGDDTYTQKARKLFKLHFGQQAEVLFVFGGTGANIVALDAVTKPFQSILAWEKAHINADECGAIEKITGSRIIPVSSLNGKLTIEALKPHLIRIGDVHHAQPAVVSISQTTECGTVYNPGEIRELTEFAHSHGMLVHLDGARIANAAASLSCTLKEMATDTGVDILSFGGTKNGMMFGEAVVILNAESAEFAKYYRKQNGQLPSKQRFVSAQFIAMLQGDLWFKTAKHANEMAKRLQSKIQHLKQVNITQSVDANVVFVQLEKQVIDNLLKSFKFYVWDEQKNEVRLMTSFDTTAEEVDAFAAEIAKSIS